MKSSNTNETNVDLFINRFSQYLNDESAYLSCLYDHFSLIKTADEALTLIDILEKKLDSSDLSVKQKGKIYEIIITFIIALKTRGYFDLSTANKVAINDCFKKFDNYLLLGARCGSYSMMANYAIYIHKAKLNPKPEEQAEAKSMLETAYRAKDPTAMIAYADFVYHGYWGITASKEQAARIYHETVITPGFNFAILSQHWHERFRVSQLLMADLIACTANDRTPYLSTRPYDLVPYKAELADQLRFSLEEYSPAQKLKILTAAIDPSTRLGAIFHTHRGYKFWAEPNTVHKIRIEYYKLKLQIWRADRGLTTEEHRDAVTHKDELFKAFQFLSTTNPQYLELVRDKSSWLYAILAEHRGLSKSGKTKTLIKAESLADEGSATATVSDLRL